MTKRAARELERTTPRIDGEASCPHCGGQLVWDEVAGWMHAASGRTEDAATIRSK